MKARTRRILLGMLVSAGMLIIGLIIAAWYEFGNTLPPSDGTVRLAGPDAPIEVTFDSMGIAQVWAGTETDALFALGWLHAADRMFNLDFIRRLSQGRLSELLGPSTVAFDMDRRRDGHLRLAEAAIKSLSEENHRRLQAYTDGVNAYLQSGHKPPLEYILLQKPFEAWREIDCLTALSFMTWYSDALQNRDGFYASLAREGRAGAVDSLPFEYPLWAPTTVRTGSTESSANGRSFRERIGQALAEPAKSVDAGAFTMSRSSNAWAVAPSHSASGAALFCSDPHLEIARLPQFWYAVGLHVREPRIDAIGITVPGLPFLVMGHNGRAAWAFTAAGVDLVDYYLERVNPADTTQYLERIDPSLGPDSLAWRTFDVEVDSITIAFADSAAHFTIRRTHHGPVRPDWCTGDSVYAVRWAGQDADLDAAVTAGFTLVRMSDFETFRGTVTSMGALNANWMYADSAGNIGFQLGSPVPVRGAGSPLLPVEGWRPENDWAGYLPMETLPHALNPPAGWLASCNNKAGDTPEIPGAYAADRILRIAELLESKTRFTTDDMRRFQMDLVDSYRLRWKGLIDSAARGLIDTTGTIEAIRTWDGSADTASLAAGAVIVFIDELTNEVFSDELPGHANEIGALTLDHVMFGGDSVWIDDIATADRVESRREIARRALERTLLMAGGKTWGQMQSLSMAHPMASVPVVGGLIDLAFGPWPWGGSPGTLNASYHERAGAGEFHTIVGPSWRFVLDLADVDGAMMVIPAGNSGNPFSPHFFDFFPRWRSGDMWNVPLSRDRVFARAASVLRLEPAASGTVAE